MRKTVNLVNLKNKNLQKMSFKCFLVRLKNKSNFFFKNAFRGFDIYLDFGCLQDWESLLQKVQCFSC